MQPDEETPAGDFELPDSEPLRELSTEDLGPLRILSTISHLLNEPGELDDVLARVMDLVVRTLGAERGFVMLDHGGEEMEVVVARGLEPEMLDSEEFRYSRSVVHRVRDTGQPIVSHDASEDQRFAGSKSLKMVGTRSMVCVPVRSQTRSLGLIYVDSRITSGIFSETDLQLLGIIADMAAVAIERSLYYAHMVQAEKMAAMGTLVAGVAQELDAPLLAIAEHCEQLHLQLPEEATESKTVQEIQAHVRRCRNGVRSLLRLSKQSEGPRQPASLAAVSEKAVEMVRSDYQRDDIEISCEASNSLPLLRLNEEQWVQALVNLLTNAREALKGRGKGKVAVTVLQPTSGEITITVIDNGPGIPPSLLRQIFDPFFSTHPPGQAAGLGLSITQQIVAGSGGRIHAQNRTMGGARFLITLPLPATPN